MLFVKHLGTRWRLMLMLTLTLTLTGAVSASAAGDDLRLLTAVKAGDVEAVRTMLQPSTDVDVNAPQADGTTALHWAVRVDSSELVQLLLRAGADVTVANRYGVTPMSLAAVNGNAVVLETLLDAGADPNTALPEGETVLMTAARTGDVEALKVLVSRGADVNAHERWLGETAVMWAAVENHPAVIRLLAEVGANLNAVSAALDYGRKVGGQTTLPVGGFTALMFAAREGANESVRALTELGADPNVTDPEGATALVLAIINAHYDTAALLVEQGADPNIADESGMAALYAAVDMHTLPFMHGRPDPKVTGELDEVDLVELLLAHGANVDQTLKTPLLRRHNNASNQALGGGTTPLMRAANSGDVRLMRVLLEHGADPNLTQENGTTLLILASGFGRRGDHNADSQEYWRGTEEEFFAAVQVCVNELGQDVDAANQLGDTALHVAAGPSIVRFLVEHGASLDAMNKQGKTPLDAALARKDKSDRQLRPEAVAALLELTERSGVDAAPSPALAQ